MGAVRAVGSAVAALGAAALLAAAPASAEPVRIASYGSGPGEVWNPKGVAVDGNPSSANYGDLYVADRNNFRIDRFGPGGDFQLAWGWGVADGTGQELQVCGPAAPESTQRCFHASSSTATGPGAVTPEAVAVDRSSGDVYVAESINRRIAAFGPDGEFRFMFGKGVDQGGGTPANPGNICTAEYVENGDTCGRGEGGAGAGEFSAPQSLAFDPAGELWVGDTDRLAALGPDGGFLGEIALPGCGEVRSLAIDSEGDFYVKCRSMAGVRRLEAGTGALVETLDEAGDARAVAVDGADRVYVGDCGGGVGNLCPAYRFMVFEAGVQVSAFGAGQAIGGPGGERGSNALAVDDGAGTLYAASSRSSEAESVVQAFPIPAPGPLVDAQRAEDVGPTTATLAATLNPENEETAYRFEYDTSPYAEGEPAGEHGTQVGAGSLPASFEGADVEARIEGLLPDTTYHFRLCATNATASTCGPDTTFKTRTAVGIEAQWAAALGARDAALRATLDPLGATEVTWWVRYGPGGALDHETAHQQLAGGDPRTVSANLAGLDPATAYSYRFLAHATQDGHQYTVEGGIGHLITRSAGLGSTLPDSRAWEMVSPPDKHGGLIKAPPLGATQAAADGEALAYLSLGSLEARPEGNGAPRLSLSLARRGPGGAWAGRDLTPPHLGNPGSGPPEYKLFSAGLERALLERSDSAPLSPAASEPTPYLRENAEPPDYTPLVGPANAPGASAFGGQVKAQGATADLSHVVLRSNASLAKGIPGGALYEWSGGTLTPLSVPPGGGTAVSANLGSEQSSVRGAISADGTRAFWSTGGIEPDGLYVRDTLRGQSARLDVVQPGAFGTGKEEPLFQAASADGRFAFFTDPQNLTPEANETGADLYRCEVVVRAGSLKCELSDLSAETKNPADPFESAEVQGLLPGVGEDGRSAYLVARGVLDDRPNGEGDSAASGQPNLYAWSEAGGMRFVARLAEEDRYDWAYIGPSSRFLAPNLAPTASPQGRYLAFMSERPLTGYDNTAAGGEAAQEVFLYDAATERLVCVSCEPGGARPRSFALGAGGGLPEEVDPNGLWSGRAVAGLVAQATRTEEFSVSLYRPRALHDDGRLFFNAADSLVPADSNGAGDVYQYEPSGTGGCTASAADAGTAVVSGGCVSLLSSGTAEGPGAAFLDASESGDDVFFYTPARLSVTDTDEVTDVYDARVGGEPASLEPLAECQGEACQPPAAAPAYGAGATATHRGPGNPRAGRCAGSTRRARALSRRARTARRHARSASRRTAHRPAWRRAARRLAHRARAQSKRARRCRRAARRSRR